MLSAHDGLQFQHFYWTLRPVCSQHTTKSHPFAIVQMLQKIPAFIFKFNWYKLPFSAFCPAHCRQLTFAHGRPAREGDLPWGKDSGCLASLLNRLQKFQQIGVYFILMGSRQAVRPPWIIDFLCSLDEPGRLFC